MTDEKKEVFRRRPTRNSKKIQHKNHRWVPTAPQRAKMIRARELGYTYNKIAKMVGTTVETLRKARDRDPEFELQLDVASELFNISIQDALADLVEQREKSVVIHLSKSRLKNRENQTMSADEILKAVKELLAKDDESDVEDSED